MDSSMNSIELNCAALHLDPAENLKSIRRKWKHRRSRSTSNLLSHQGKPSDSEDDGGEKDRIDSDDAERSLAKLSLQSTSASTSKCFPHSSGAGVLVESDSFNEFFGASNSQGKSSNGRRRRRHKRIAIDDPSSMNEDSMPDCIMAPPKEYSDAKSDDAGKRKRSQREKALAAAAAAAILPSSSSSSNSMQYNYNANARTYSNRGPTFPAAGPTSSFQPPDFMNVDLLTMASEIMDEDMKSDDDSSISSNDGNAHESCDEGREGDDEHSDWVGDEWMEDSGASEIRDFVVLRRFRDRIPSREIRAGKRRVHPNKPPVFSIRSSYNEQLAKFLQDPEERQLTLHPLEKEEITQLNNLASLYSLQLNTVKDDQGLNCHILMKTPHTTQMEGKDLKLATPPSPIVSESDTKRVKVKV